jgi:hypothetical protein
MLEVLVAIGQVLGFARTVESIQRLWGKWCPKPAAETLAGRFFRLFEAHGVHRNQIPRFFGHGLQLKDVQDEAALLPCLTDTHVADACQLFGVERQWLERGEGNARVRHHFYLQPVVFGNFLDAALVACKALPNAEVTATLFGVLEGRSEVESILVVSEPIGFLNDDVIYRYHLVNAGPLGYWKARVSTAALVAQAMRHATWVTGRNCNAKLFEELTDQKDLVGIREFERLTHGSRHFEVDDWLLEPTALLDGVDPERNRFGTLSALEHWLKLDTEGLMKHPYGQAGTRAKFEAALEQQKAV